MNEDRCDLHCHSTFSDGTLTPTELVLLAKSLNLKALALTDHNTALGLREFMEAGKNNNFITVPGCEFTTEWNNKELHIVGLFFKEKYYQEIQDYVEIMHLAKRNSNEKMINLLRKDGYDITFEEVLNMTSGDGFNRAHVARALMAKGYVESVSEAFSTLLKDGNGYYFPAKKLSALGTIRFIKTFGATAIIAHPFLNLTEEELRIFLPEAKENGLDAMETHYTEYSPAIQELAISIAKEFGIKESGGSDFHGETKPTISLGSGHGDLFVPYHFYEDMLSCTEDK